MRKLKNFNDVNNALLHYMPSSVESSYTLDRMTELMVRLGNPQNKIKIVHVAGTSGKTSTCYYIASLLVTAGLKVGLSVSPHIDEVNERVQVDMQPLPEIIFASELSDFIDIVSKTDVKPTYFELLVGFAYWYFAKIKVDYAVMEVGLGGLLDGTNIVNSPDKVCVITDIGLDHTRILGKTIPKIAAQKAGIIQMHNPVFMYAQDNQVMDVVKARCKQLHAQLYEVEQKIDIKDSTSVQKRNFNLAYSVYDLLQSRDELPKLTHEQLLNAAKITIPARMEIVHNNDQTIVIDGSHNFQKVEALATSLKELFTGSKIAGLVSFVSHKEPYASEALEILLPHLDSLILTTFDSSQDSRHKSMGPSLLARVCEQQGFRNYQIITDPKKAYLSLVSSGADVLLITGSFYLLNHIRPLILKT